MSWKSTPDEYNVDLIILAGYMRVIKKPDEFSCPIINVHPSLLPKYKGLHAVEQAMESGDKMTGCTVHYVNEEYDEGKIIKQFTTSIDASDDSNSLFEKIRELETLYFPQVVESEILKRN